MIGPLIAACLANASVHGAAPLEDGLVSSPSSQGAPLPLASLDDALDVTGQAIAARQIRRRLSVPVEVNGSGPFEFMVDTGADGSAVGRHLATVLNLPTQGCVRVHGTAGTALVPAVHLTSLRVGSGLVENLSAPVLSETALGADGVIGLNALASQRLKMDFDAETITLEDSNRREATSSGDPGEIVVTARRQRGQLILTAGSSGGVRMLAVIDTGANVTVGNSALRTLLFGQRRGLEATSVTLVSVTGQSATADLVIVPELTIGRLSIRNVPIAFADVPPFKMFGISGAPAVLLGTDVLRAFKRVTLDFRRHRVRFSARSSTAATASSRTRESGRL